MNGQQPTFQVPPAKFQPSPPQPVKPNKLRLIILIFILIVVIGGGAAYYFLVYNQEDTNQNTNQNVSTRNVNTTVNVNKSTNVNSVSNTNSQNVNTSVNTNVIQPSVDALDTDGDGLLNLVESWYGTDIAKADTDGDGYSDNVEVGGCYDPTGSGRITVAFYTSYCDRQLTWWDPTLTAASRQTLCEIWSPYAQRYINAKTNDTIVNLGGLNQSCNQLLSDKNITSQHTDEILCNDMGVTAMDLCYGHGLDSVINGFSEIN